MDLKTEEYVNVAVRIRPSLNVLQESVALRVVNKNPPVLYADNRQSYTFNYIFTAETSQADVYNGIVHPFVQKVLLGYNCTVFAYGQTGTGKTYTMGSDPKMNSDPGFILRAFDEIFAQTQQNKELEVYVSFYEIYNEKVYDLLSNTKTSLLVKGFKVEGLAQTRVDTTREAQNLLNIGSRNRHVGETKLNASSSRSHAIFTIHCNTKNNNSECEAKLNFVDLAGSESARRTGNEGFQFQEGININIGLFNVRRVMSALSTNMPHVPYRESMITTILQDSLSRTNFITLLACVSPDVQDINETVQTLEFAQGAKKLKNKPEVNNIIQQYKKQNPALFDRPLLTNSTSKQRTPLKRQHFSMECTPGPSLVQKPKVINNTWTPMSTVTEQVCESTYISISPIVRKCAEVFENTMLEKFETFLGRHTNKPNTPKFCWDKLKAEVSQIVHNEIIQLTGQRSRACSSPIDGYDVTSISGPFTDKRGSFAVAKRLDFDESEFKAPTRRAPKRKADDAPLRRSTRLSRLPKVDVVVPTRRQSTRLLEKSPPNVEVSLHKPIPAPRKAKKVDNQNDKRVKHQQYVLSVLNEGDERDLKKLATIGPKTAAQIYLYRQLHGRFKNVKELKKMETWKGQAYQRFLNSNFISDSD